MSTLLDDSQTAKLRQLLSDYAAVLEEAAFGAAAEAEAYDQQLSDIAELTDYLTDVDNNLTEQL